MNPPNEIAKTTTNGHPHQTNTPDWLGIVREKVESLRYGVVQIVIHDGKVTQIEKTEKTRLESRG